MNHCEPDKYTVVRSEHADERYINKLNVQLHQVLVEFCGNETRLLAKLSRFVSGVLYYAVTVLARRQTLGHEMFSLLLYDKDGQRIPTTFRIFAYVCFKSVKNLFVSLRLDTAWLRLAQLCVVLTEKLVYIAFMLNVTGFISLEHLFSRIGYHQMFKDHLSGVSGGGGNNSKLIAYLKVFELCLFFVIVGRILVKKARRLRLKKESKKNEARGASDESSTLAVQNKVYKFKCFICFERVRVPTATGCGHIYCWTCVNSLIVRTQQRDTTRAKCPICRTEIQPSRVICLNY
jgi:hypothetical protein